MDRALQFNLGLLLQEEAAQSARGARWRALSDLLPKVAGTLGQRRQVINLEAFGFPAPDPIVGPFNVFDARIGLSQPVIDLRAWHDHKAAGYEERAAQANIRSGRKLVVLRGGQPVSRRGRATGIEVVGAAGGHALLTQAQDLKASGLVAGIDVLGANVEVQTLRQRRVAAENDAAKAKLRLARAIGLPPGQAVILADAIPYNRWPR